MSRPTIRKYLGDSRGRWEGDTLVVETTNFHPNGNPMGGYFTLSDPNLRLVERFKRVAADTLEYTFTVDNPTMWTRPWTAVINWKQSKGEVPSMPAMKGTTACPGCWRGTSGRGGFTLGRFRYMEPDQRMDDRRGAHADRGQGAEARTWPAPSRYTVPTPANGVSIGVIREAAGRISPSIRRSLTRR